uniref:BTB domain-containing protein n=1 Tax=Strongyloides venezuelensis TaxID=75913 RepID=A0A0K0F7C7_STRVS
MSVRTNNYSNKSNSISINNLISSDNKYASQILSKLYTDYRKQDLDSCNIQIIINGNKSIYAHKLVLQAYSNFFRKMLGTEKVISFNDPEINIKTMKLLMRYLYKGVFKTNSEKYFMRVKHLAKKLEINDLYKALSKYEANSSGNFEIVNNNRLKEMDKNQKSKKKGEKINKKSKKQPKSNKGMVMNNKSSPTENKITKKKYDMQVQDIINPQKSKKLKKYNTSGALKNSVKENIKNLKEVSLPHSDNSNGEKNIFDNYKGHPLMYSSQKNNYKIYYSDSDDDFIKKTEKEYE